MDPVPQKRSRPSKRGQILAGAREVFMETGFERASVDVIATRAGVSKATVYHHFPGKKALFVACFSEGADELRDEFRACLEACAGDVEDALQTLGEKLMAVLVAPAVVCLYRHTAAETARFPDIGQMLFERGPAVLYDLVAQYLVCWHERGVLRIDDPPSAAVQFTMLCQGDLALRAQLGILGYPADELIRDTVARAVQVFVRAYRR